MHYARILAAIAAFLVTVSVGVARAEMPEEFYKGKSFNIYVGYTAGGGYDIYARLLARHLGKYIPGAPTVVVRNMEGAGSLRLANWLYAVAPRDGTTIGTIGRGAPFDQILGRPGIQFDATKFTWIGSMNNEVAVCATWHASGVSTFDELTHKEVITGAAGAGNDDDLFPRVLNGVLGTKMRVISGYPGTSDVTLAIERGEVQARCGWSWSAVKTGQPTWITEKKINILAQLALSKHPDLPDVPLIMDLAKTDEQRQILKLIFARQSLGRPFLGPADIPADRTVALQNAFSQAMRSPELLADAEKGKAEINPLSGQEVEAIISQVFKETSSSLAKRVAEIVSTN